MQLYATTISNVEQSMEQKIRGRFKTAQGLTGL
jgi:hypothetical protein